jgi:hypothetical protein
VKSEPEVGSHRGRSCLGTARLTERKDAMDPCRGASSLTNQSAESVRDVGEQMPQFSSFRTLGSSLIVIFFLRFHVISPARRGVRRPCAWSQDYGV